MTNVLVYKSLHYIGILKYSLVHELYLTHHSLEVELNKNGIFQELEAPDKKKNQ